MQVTQDKRYFAPCTHNPTMSEMDKLVDAKVEFEKAINQTKFGVSELPETLHIWVGNPMQLRSMANAVAAKVCGSTGDATRWFSYRGVLFETYSPEVD